jgi:hypothetical protein
LNRAKIKRPNAKDIIPKLAKILARVCGRERASGEPGSVECAGGFSFSFLVGGEREARRRARDARAAQRRMCLVPAPLSAPLTVIGLDLKLMSSLCRNEIFIAERQLLAWEAAQFQGKIVRSPTPSQGICMPNSQSRRRDARLLPP